MIPYVHAMTDAECRKRLAVVEHIVRDMQDATDPTVRELFVQLVGALKGNPTDTNGHRP